MHISHVLPILAIALFAAACQHSTDPVEAAASASAASTATSIARATTTVHDVLAANCGVHEETSDYVWDASAAVPIVLTGSGATESSDNVTVTGGQVTITAGGTYRLSGRLSNGEVIVSAPSTDVVRVILNGVTLSNTSFSPLHFTSAAKIILVLADGTTNTVTDGSAYTFPNASDTEPNAAIFSKCNLTICGSGTLNVSGNYNDGISSKDGLIIKNATIVAKAADDGIRGKDYLLIHDGTIGVTASGDGLKSDNDEDATRGYICVESGTVSVVSGGDALAAATDAVIAGGVFDLVSGGGSGTVVSGTTSSKGIKGTQMVVVGNGTLAISSADDAIHSNSAAIINGGTLTLSSGDDGIHADSVLGINGGIITITKSYEGLESTALVINDGNIHVTSSDDGINGAGGNDGSGAGGFPGGAIPTGNRVLYINGGYVAVNANGDGVDVNGSITMTGGTLIVHGPTSNANGPLDYDASFTMSGGFLVAAGSSGMAMAPGSTSSQNSVLVTFSSARPATTLFHLQAADGTNILTFKSAKSYQSVAICSPGLAKGSIYEIYGGGSSTGTATDGVFDGGTYSGGTRSAGFTISETVTRVNG